MGSIISLGVENFEIDWGKNEFFRNHSCLFFPSDRTDGTYFYAGDTDEEVVRRAKPVYARQLRSVKRRLDLLGYSMEACRSKFDEQRTFFFRHQDSDEHQQLTFDRFATVIQSVDVTKLNIPGPSDNYDFGEYAARCILSDPGFPSLGMSEHDLRWSAGEFLDNMDPYLTLRLLAENPTNLDHPVIWRYHDVVEGGYVEESSIFEGLASDAQVLVVTEGSSDSGILKKALGCRFQEVEDFFLFVDMKDNYPFTGTGNLLRFVQGLRAIQHRRKTLVVLDNDTAGNEVASRLNEQLLPKNFVVCVLPELAGCNQFQTVGPSGPNRENVNGKACAIEMFLDLGFGMSAAPIPTVRWTAFNAKLQQYQGELEDKEQFTRAFLQSGWRSPDYDWSKLTLLWEHLFDKCCAI